MDYIIQVPCKSADLGVFKRLFYTLPNTAFLNTLAHFTLLHNPLHVVQIQLPPLLWPLRTSVIFRPSGDAGKFCPPPRRGAASHPISTPTWASSWGGNGAVAGGTAAGKISPPSTRICTYAGPQIATWHVQWTYPATPSPLNLGRAVGGNSSTILRSNLVGY